MCVCDLVTVVYFLLSLLLPEKSLWTKRDFLLSDTTEGQYLQAEDRGNKLKQLLVKAKKDLAEARHVETEQRTANAQLRAQLEMLTQQGEEHKVSLVVCFSVNNGENMGA